MLIAYIHRAAETGVAAGTIGRVGGARGDTIAVAIANVAQIRATFNNFSVAAFWVTREWAKPIAAPVPHVASHVIQAIAVGRETFGGCSAGVTIGAAVERGEFALPNVAHMLTVWS